MRRTKNKIIEEIYGELIVYAAHTSNNTWRERECGVQFLKCMLQYHSWAMHHSFRLEKIYIKAAMIE